MSNQPKLVTDILKRLSKAGVLDDILLIGSWSTTFYKDYFKGVEYVPIIRTRDIDFLVPYPTKFKRETDLQEILSDLGFETDFKSNGLMKLENDELILEFLVPEVGPPKTKPHPLPQLKFNAQPLRHLLMLWRDPIVVKVSGICVQVPHPADYCLHKLFIFDRRKTEDKKRKDYASAIQVLEALIEQKDLKNLSLSFKALSKKEQKRVMAVLKEAGYQELDALLSPS